MKTFWLIAVFLVPGVCAAQADRTDQIIQKAVTAMGGLDRIHAIHSLVFRGFHYEGSYKQEFAGSKTGDAVLIRMRPGARLVGCRPEVPGLRRAMEPNRRGLRRTTRMGIELAQTATGEDGQQGGTRAPLRSRVRFSFHRLQAARISRGLSGTQDCSGEASRSGSG